MERELNNIGVIYSVQGQYAEALDYLLQNAKIREELGDKLGTVEALHFIGGVYLLKGDYAQALALEQKAAQQAEALGNNELLSGSLRNISEAYLRLNQYQPAREYAERAASVASRAAIPDVLWNVKAIAGKARCKSSSGSWAQSCSNSAAVISNACAICSNVATPVAGNSVITLIPCGFLRLSRSATRKGRCFLGRVSRVQKRQQRRIDL